MSVVTADQFFDFQLHDKYYCLSHDVFNHIMSFVPAWPYLHSLRRVARSWKVELEQHVFDRVELLDLMDVTTSVDDHKYRQFRNYKKAAITKKKKKSKRQLSQQQQQQQAALSAVAAASAAAADVSSDAMDEENDVIVAEYESEPEQRDAEGDVVMSSDVDVGQAATATDSKTTEAEITEVTVGFIERTSIIDCFAVCFPNVKAIKFIADRDMILNTTGRRRMTQLRQLLSSFPKLESIYMIIDATVSYEVSHSLDTFFNALEQSLGDTCRRTFRSLTIVGIDFSRCPRGYQLKCLNNFLGALPALRHLEFKYARFGASEALGLNQLTERFDKFKKDKQRSINTVATVLKDMDRDYVEYVNYLLTVPRLPVGSIDLCFGNNGLPGLTAALKLRYLQTARRFIELGYPLTTEHFKVACKHNQSAIAMQIAELLVAQNQGSLKCFAAQDVKNIGFIVDSSESVKLTQYLMDHEAFANIPIIPNKDEEQKRRERMRFSYVEYEATSLLDVLKCIVQQRAVATLELFHQRMPHIFSNSEYNELFLSLDPGADNSIAMLKCLLETCRLNPTQVRGYSNFREYQYSFDRMNGLYGYILVYEISNKYELRFSIGPEFSKLLAFLCTFASLCDLAAVLTYQDSKDSHSGLHFLVDEVTSSMKYSVRHNPRCIGLATRMDPLSLLFMQGLGLEKPAFAALTTLQSKETMLHLIMKKQPHDYYAFDTTYGYLLDMLVMNSPHAALDAQGNTPLHNATHITSTKKLIQEIKDPKLFLAVNADGRTPFMQFLCVKESKRHGINWESEGFEQAFELMLDMTIKHAESDTWKQRDCDGYHVLDLTLILLIRIFKSVYLWKEEKLQKILEFFLATAEKLRNAIPASIFKDMLLKGDLKSKRSTLGNILDAQTVLPAICETLGVDPLNTKTTYPDGTEESLAFAVARSLMTDKTLMKPLLSLVKDLSQFAEIKTADGRTSKTTLLIEAIRSGNSTMVCSLIAQSQHKSLSASKKLPYSHKLKLSADDGQGKTALIFACETKDMDEAILAILKACPSAIEDSMPFNVLDILTQKTQDHDPNYDLALQLFATQPAAKPSSRLQMLRIVLHPVLAKHMSKEGNIKHMESKFMPNAAKIVEVEKQFAASGQQQPSWQQLLSMNWTEFLAFGSTDNKAEVTKATQPAATIEDAKLKLPLLCLMVTCGCFAEVLRGICQTLGAESTQLLLQSIKIGEDIIFHFACRNRLSSKGQLASFKALVEGAGEGGKALLDTRTTGGDAALHLACAEKDSDLVELLLDSGADRSVRNAKGLLPEEMFDAKCSFALRWAQLVVPKRHAADSNRSTRSTRSRATRGSTAEAASSEPVAPTAPASEASASAADEATTSRRKRKRTDATEQQTEQPAASETNTEETAPRKRQRRSTK